MHTTSVVPALNSARRLAPRVERPQLRTVYQLAGEVLGQAGERTADTMRRCYLVALQWTQEKYAEPLPAAALTGASFVTEMPGGGAKVECVALSEYGIWSLRFVHPDLPFDGNPAVPGRTWAVEVALQSDESAVRLAVHVQCASPPGTEEPIKLTRPGVVTALSREVELRDIRPLSHKAWVVGDEASCRELAYFLTDLDRQLPVHVLTPMDPGKQFELKSPTPQPLDSDHLANALYGLAHVVVLTREATKHLASQLGRNWGVFGGATRTYLPQLDLADSAYADHPLVLPDRMARFESRVVSGFKAFGSFLERRTRDWNSTARFEWGPCQFLADAQQKQMELARRSVTSEADLRRLIGEQATTYEHQILEKEAEANSWFEQAAQAEKEREYYRDQNRRLSFQLDTLRAAIKQGGAAPAVNLIPSEPTYEGLAGWADEHLVGRVELHPRAIRALKVARYEDPRLVYEGLQLLATNYRDAKIGVDGAKPAFDEGLKRLGLELGGSISRELAGTEGKTYFVKWPLHGIEEEFLEFALKKGSNKDERYTLRIYFFWDDDSQQVIVGSLPGHLDNRMT